MGKNALEFFRELSAIPRGSGNEKGAADWVCNFAAERGLSCVRDEADNVFIKKPASPGRESEPVVLLQGHLDMVCEKNSGTAHDFTTDGLRLVEKDGWLRADGTTLGADDGFAVAYALALLDDETLSHPALEVLFTTGEEVGLSGAKAFDASLISADRLVNLDSDVEGTVTVACAGGERHVMTRDAVLEKRAGYRIDISVTGLFGGHSGADIHLKRANALKLMAQLLGACGDGAGIISIGGGDKDNAIPRECFASVAVDDTEAAEKAQETAAALSGSAENEPSLKISVSCEAFDGSAVSADITHSVISLMRGCPNGPLAYEEVGDTVKTSSNLASISMKDGVITIVASTRSSDEAALDALASELDALADRCGFSIVHKSRYPGWRYDGETSLARDYISTYAHLYPNRPRPVQCAIHAGLECGIFKSRVPKLEIISVGCDIFDIHTPDEKMNLASFERVYNVLRTLLSEK